MMLSQRNLAMQNANLKEDQGRELPVKKSAQAPGRYSTPEPTPPAVADADPVPQSYPELPQVQSHGGIGPGRNKQTHIHPIAKPGQSGLVSDIMHRATSSTSEELGAVSSAPPTSAMTAQGIIGHPADNSTTDGRRAKRELSQSKRAAQNRAAQRAFRQRKEHYIKKLEQQVRDTELDNKKRSALAEYVITLQSRLREMGVQLPPPPAGLLLDEVMAPPQPHISAPADPTPNGTSAGTLADVAAAVAGLRAREPVAEGGYAKAAFSTESNGVPHPNDDIRR